MSVGFSGPALDLVGDLDQELRAVVRRERVDPQLDSARVRRLAEEVVRAHDERSLTGVVAPVPDGWHGINIGKDMGQGTRVFIHE